MMQYADAHSDFGILRFMVKEGTVSRLVEDVFVRDLEVVNVGFSVL
jgi:hypothetical protein